MFELPPVMESLSIRSRFLSLYDDQFFFFDLSVLGQKSDSSPTSVEEHVDMSKV